MGDQYYVVRGIGLVKNVSDIENSLVMTKNGKPILIKNLATVLVSNNPRLGVIGYNHENDKVLGAVWLRKDAQSIPAMKSVHEKIKELNEHILPKGIYLRPFYDRWDLIVTVVDKVIHNATVGVILVIIALFLFLGDLRGALVVALSIPISLLISLSIMAVRGESANFLSIGAIDYGIIVDIPLILMENYYRLAKKHGPGVSTIIEATNEVNKPIFFSL
jgi:heavy metal efflux system protein